MVVSACLEREFLVLGGSGSGSESISDSDCSGSDSGADSESISESGSDDGDEDGKGEWGSCPLTPLSVPVGEPDCGFFPLKGMLTAYACEFPPKTNMEFLSCEPLKVRVYIGFRVGILDRESLEVVDAGSRDMPCRIVCCGWRMSGGRSGVSRCVLAGG